MAKKRTKATSERTRPRDLPRSRAGRRGLVWLLAAAALLGALVFLNSLRNDFVWDDHQLIVENHTIKSWPLLVQSLDHDFFYRNENDLAYGYYRPLVLLSYALDYASWALDPFGYHLTNLLLHVACTVMVGWILFRLGVGRVAAGLGAALFGVHPIHTETVAWISGRTDLVAFFFAALSLLFYLVARGPLPGEDGRESPPAHPRLWLVGSVITFGLAMLAKEMAVVLLPWLALLELLAYRRDWRRALRGAVPWAGVVAVYLTVRFLILDVPAPGTPPGHTLLTVVLSAAPTLGRYLLWLVLPVDLSGYVQNPYVESPLDPRLLLSLLCFGIVGAGFWTVWKRGQLATSRGRSTLLLTAMLLVSFGPILNFVRAAGPPDMGNMMAERFLYFPSFPFAGLVGLALVTLAERLRKPLGADLARRSVAVLAVLLVALAGWQTVRRNREWADDLTFFTRTVEQAPTAPLLWSQLVVTRILRGDMEPAREALDRALSFRVGDYFVLSAQALWYTVNRQYHQALEIQRRIAGQAREGKAAAYNNLAFLYRVTGQTQKAEGILDELVEDGLGYSDVQFNLGEIYRERGELERARDAYALAYRERLHDPAVGNALADAESRLGRPEAAIRVYEELLRHHPGDSRLLNNLALSRRQAGDLEGALTAMREAVDRDPGFVAARVNYAALLADAGRRAEAEIQLETAVRIGAGTPDGQRASRILQELAEGGG